MTAIPKFLDLVTPKLAVPPPRNEREAAESEDGVASERRWPLPEQGVLYISGVEKQEGNPDPAALFPIVDLLPGAYEGDKAVWHFKSEELLANDSVRTKQYDEKGVFRPKGEGTDWRLRRLGLVDEDSDREDRNDRGGRRGPRGGSGRPPRGNNHDGRRGGQGGPRGRDRRPGGR